MLSHNQFMLLYSIGNGEMSSEDMRQAWEAVNRRPTKHPSSVYTIVRRLVDAGLVQKETRFEPSAEAGNVCNHSYYSLTSEGIEAVNGQIEFYKLSKLLRKKTAT